MLNEIDTNLPPERAERAPRAVGAPELAFALGGILATLGVALVSVPVALVARGALLMLASWRSA